MHSNPHQAHYGKAQLKEKLRLNTKNTNCLSLANIFYLVDQIINLSNIRLQEQYLLIKHHQAFELAFLITINYAAKIKNNIGHVYTLYVLKVK